MKKKLILYLISIIVFASGCSSDKQEDSLPCVDVTKNYPEKEIILTDIADVTFLCLNSDNEDFLYNGRINCITKNTIVILNRALGSILFFSKDGSPKSHFNNKGQGPGDYANPYNVIYDEEADEVFVFSLGLGIQVYSSVGEHKRKITLPAEFASNLIFSFDNESFFLCDERQIASGIKREKIEETDYPVQFYNHPFVRISKADGKVLDYVELPSNETKLIFNSATGAKIMRNPVFSTKKGLLLCNPETDTVFLYAKNKVLMPLICKTPLVKDLDPMVVMNNCLDYGGYQFMDIATLQPTPGIAPGYPIKRLIRNKKTGEVFRQKFTLSEYNGKEFFVGIGASQNYDEGISFELELVELKQAYRENKLSGKLKELVETLNEDKDNNVFMFVNFKE